MNEIDILIMKVIEIRNQKLSTIRLQKYEQAAQLRDTERQFEEKIYNKINGLEDVERDYDWKLFEETINGYLLKEYGLKYTDSFLQLKRQISLKELGI